jgi:hypothetical protein
MSRRKREATHAARGGRQSGPIAAATKPVEGAERLVVLVVALLLIAAAAAPIVSGYLHERAGERFLGLVPEYFEDCQSYLAWMRQAEQGHLLFRDLFTSEPHRNVIALPLFWAMGTAARATGMPLVAVWWVVHAMAIVLMVVAVHAFAARFCADRATRLLALGLAATASGVGSLLPASALAGGTGAAIKADQWMRSPIDLWMVESNQFYAAATTYFTLPMSLALLLLALLRVLRYLEDGRQRDAVIAGSLALTLAVIHHYDVVTLFAVAGAWVLLLRAWRWRGLALVAAIPAPFLLYGVAVVKLHPVLSRLIWEMPVPTPQAFVLGWGIPLLLAAGAALAPSVRRGNRDISLLLAWLAVVALLLVVPVDFRRKLVWGAQVPIAVLAAIGARRAWARLGPEIASVGRRRIAAWSAALVLLAVCAQGSFARERELLRRSARHDAEDFVPLEFVEGLDWLRQRARPGDVVMSSPTFAPLVPGWTGATVFTGHWAQTIDIDAKARFVELMFRRSGFVVGSELRRVLDRNRVRFVVLDAGSMSLERLPEQLPDDNLATVARLALRNRKVAIWEVEPPPEGSAVTPWATGDWLRP